MNKYPQYARAFGKERAAILLFGLYLVLSLATLKANNDAREKTDLNAQAFDLSEVRLLNGPFQHAMELDRQYLSSFDPNRLLRNFRVTAGLQSTAEPLGGWEAPSCELRGHFVGHYLSACAMMYASTGDAQLKANADAVVAGMAECQAKLGTSGYLSAFPEAFFDRLESHQGVWAPYYTIHKILEGLLDAHVYLNNPQALDVARKLGDWMVTRNMRLADAQLQSILGTEQGGITEALANLSSLTGEQKYLTLARRFNHHAVIDPASRQEDRLNGLHANTQIPKFIGAAREYELTGDQSLKTAALFFWDTVVRERSFVTGGTSDGEYFTPKEKLSQSIGHASAESCDTHNLLKLSRYMFSWDPQAEYADYYERGMYNAVLASQDPNTGMMCHYLPLQSGSQKFFGSPFGDLSCCYGTGIESHAKYGDSIYFHEGNQGLYVNLFIASELDWKTNGLKIRQETKYPEGGATHLVFSCDHPRELALHLRHPAWATAGFGVSINGAQQTLDTKPGSYATINRAWKTGDTVDVCMPFTLRTQGFADNPRRRAVLYGPLVLSAEIDRHQPIPVIFGSEDEMLAALKPIPGRANTFTAAPTVFRPQPSTPSTGLVLKPFYQLPGKQDYIIYWDLKMSPSLSSVSQ